MLDCSWFGPSHNRILSCVIYTTTGNCINAAEANCWTVSNQRIRRTTTLSFLQPPCSAIRSLLHPLRTPVNRTKCFYAVIISVTVFFVIHVCFVRKQQGQQNPRRMMVRLALALITAPEELTVARFWSLIHKLVGFCSHLLESWSVHCCWIRLLILGIALCIFTSHRVPLSLRSFTNILYCFYGSCHILLLLRGSLGYSPTICFFR